MRILSIAALAVAVVTLASPATVWAKVSPAALAAAVAGPCGRVTPDEEAWEAGPNLTPCVEAINAAFAATPWMTPDEIDRVGEGFVKALAATPADATSVPTIVTVLEAVLDVHILRNCMWGTTTEVTPTLDTCSAAIRLVLVASSALPADYQGNRGAAMCFSILQNPDWQAPLMELINAYIARGGLDELEAGAAPCYLPPAT